MTEKPRPISGFPELLPAQRLVEVEILDRLRQTFELHGFSPLETRSVETLEQLLRKGEIDNEVYVLRRLQSEDATDDTGLGLHYDLTVPFARYVLENAGKLEFPVRRYQIQKVWRGERPQEGRFREFTQADIDVVTRDSLPFHYDIEVARVMADALSRVRLPPIILQVNNRKLIEGFYRGLGIEDVAAVMRVVDKLDKLPPEQVATMLHEEAGLDDQQTKQCLVLAEIQTSDTSFVDRVREIGVTHDLLDKGLGELAAVIDGCSMFASDRLRVVADLRIARGLDYYTGTVFEARMAGFERLGSVCAGGRYDSLATDGATTYPGVGISLGVSRLLMPLLSRGLITASRSVPSCVLVALPDEESRPRCDEIAHALRQRGIPTEVAPAAQKYGRQIRFAERRGIPFVWFPQPDGAHQVRDIRTGEQVDADPGSWAPPPDDLRPTIVDHTEDQLS